MPKSTAEHTAIKMIKNQEATCVVVRDNKIISQASPKGISYIIDLYDKGALEDTFVADTIIGKAAAMIFSLGGVTSCYGKTISRSALDVLKKNNISVSYDNCTDVIQNRSGTGMCPMEETVLNITDKKEALTLLKAKVNEMKKNSKENKSC